MQSSNMVLFVCAGLLLLRRRAKRQTNNDQPPLPLPQAALPRSRTALTTTTPKESKATGTHICSEEFWAPEAIKLMESEAPKAHVGFVLEQPVLDSGGSMLGGATAWSLVRLSYFFWTTDLGAELGAMALFVAGALLCLPICWLATIVPYHRRSLPLMGTLIFMSTSSLLLLTTGMSSMMGLSNTLRHPGTVNASMHRALAQAAVNPTVEGAFESMQLDNKCCGVNSYSDWQQLSRTLPPSCCDRMKNNRSEVCEKPVHSFGCLRPALYELRYFINTVSVLASSIIVILAVTIFAASYSLVDNVLTREKPVAMRIACLHPVPAPPHAQPSSPLVPYAAHTAPAMLPSLMQPA